MWLNNSEEERHAPGVTSSSHTALYKCRNRKESDSYSGKAEEVKMLLLLIATN